MLRCLQLARNGLGTTAPNPMVGCVIVHRGKIIGEGFTSPYGGAHAEVNAINNVKDRSKLSQATLYVTLEPCSHFGKTPPCADLIIQHKIPEVVIGLEDPHEKVAGSGIQKLREAGCKVTLGILKEACQEHHKRFLTFHQKKRPYVILKWAETADGFIAPDLVKRGNKIQPYWISNKVSRRLVHQWRSEEQAVLVGTKTVLEDNPKLNTRMWSGRSPIRIVLDRDLKIPKSFEIFNGKATTFILHQTEPPPDKEDLNYRKIDYSTSVAAQICKLLHEENIQSVLIEGGSRTLQTFIESGLWDEARIFRSPNSFGDGLKAPRIEGSSLVSRTVGGDVLKILERD